MKAITNSDTFPAKISFNGYEVVQDANNDFFSISIKTGCVSDGFVSIGTTYSPSCSVNMTRTELAYAGVNFEVFFKINDVWTSFGKYVIQEEPVHRTNTTEFTGDGLLSTVCEKAMDFSAYLPNTRFSYNNAIAVFTNQTGIDVVIEGSPSYLDTPNAVSVPCYDGSLDLTITNWKSISITARKFIGGIALLMGCVAIERMGKIYIESLHDGIETQLVFDKDSYSSMSHNPNLYQPYPIKVSFQPFEWRYYQQYLIYVSGDKQTVSNEDKIQDQDVGQKSYPIEIECDWIGDSIKRRSSFFHAGSFIKYHPCDITFLGYHSNIVAGKKIKVNFEEEDLTVLCCMVTYDWSGGITTTVSNPFSASTTGSNNTSLSASSGGADIIGIQNDVRAFKSVYADYIEANDAKINNIEAISITTENLSAEVAELGYLKAETAELEYASIDTLEAAVAYIEELEAIAITTENLSASVATLGYLKVDDAELEYADIALANVEKASVATLFANVGLLDRATIVDGHVTGFLDAVEVNAANITAGTLVADRILLRGSESGLLYALNNMGELESTEVNTLDGGVITERTINADRIVAGSITANELDVESIFADTAVIAEIFAQNVTATGTITGATLTGATGSFTGKVTANSGSIGDWNIQDREFWYSETVNGCDYLTGMGGLNIEMVRDGVVKFRINMEGETLNSTGDNCLYANLGNVRLLSAGNASIVAQGGVDINCNGNMNLGLSASSVYIGNSDATTYIGSGSGSVRAGKFMRSASLYAPMTNISNMVMKTGTVTTSTTASNFFTLTHNCGFSSTGYFVWMECSNTNIAVVRVQNTSGNATGVWANAANGAQLASGTSLTLRWFAVGTA